MLECNEQLRVTLLLHDDVLEVTSGPVASKCYASDAMH